MHKINIHEAKTNFSKLITLVLSGDEVIIAKSGLAVAKLVPYNEPLKPRIPGGSWEGKVWIADDFDELPKELEQFFTGKDDNI